jgi:predicted O-methyltransferase YrrM
MFQQLKEYTDKIGTVYGTEDFAIYMYSIVKMRRPAKIVELGTGVGTTTLWMAQALKENGFGKLHTIDNGSMWAEFVKNHPKEILPATYDEFIKEEYKSGK